MSKEHEVFTSLVDTEVASQGRDQRLAETSRSWLIQANEKKYSYHFNYLGRPIIQYPQDMVAIQEIIWEVKPDLIVETGIAHGGSLIMSAGMLALVDLCEAIESGSGFDPTRPNRKVLGVDIDIRPHNRAAVEAHPMSSRIEMIEGPSTSPNVASRVRQMAAEFDRVMVFLDSNHTHDHVLEELEIYAPLVSVGSYCVVFDTVIEDLPGSMFPDRPWGPGNNPKTAAREFLSMHPEFEIDEKINHQLLISVAPDGYLRRKS